MDDTPGPLDPKPASETTRAAHGAAVIGFDDQTDEAAATRGLVAQHPTGVIAPAGQAVWDTSSHDFLQSGPDAPDTVHPGLWRQGRLNAHHGLFEVADGCWQARGYDLSNVTFIAGREGWVVIDPLTVPETAAACLELANDTLGERPVTAVIYTHSHVDHFGGVLGVTSQADVDAGRVRVIAPDGFMREAVAENALAGPIMYRRAMYQFGAILPPGPQGHIDCGLGKRVPLGSSGLIPPTESISETGTELDVDGVRVVFQNTPDAEAPAEMNFFFPDHGWLCMAENCTHTLHNLYPIRGAQVRDALAWSKYVQEALQMWGSSADLMFASHHWPRFGGDDVRAFLALQRDVYRWMHDQTMRLANRGYTPDEISETLRLPDSFSGQSHVQGYYGTVSHNVRSVYNRYLGWYDGNPANLHPHPPVEAGRRYVEMMGGPEGVMAGAQRAFDEGDYRWVVEVCGHLVFSDPEHRGARELSADAMEQLGYQAESSTWRNAYLTGAYELRHGSIQLGPFRVRELDNALSGDQLVDMMGVRFDPTRFASTVEIEWVLTDVGEVHLVGVANHTINHSVLDAPGSTADVSIACDRRALVEVMFQPGRFAGMVAEGRLDITGDAVVAEGFIGALDAFEAAALIEP